MSYDILKIRYEQSLVGLIFNLCKSALIYKINQVFKLSRFSLPN